MRARLPLILALVPVLALAGGLPFVNRLQPVVLGLPLLLFWILAWVLATPLFLALAYFLTSSEASSSGVAPSPREDAKRERRTPRSAR